MPSTYQLGVGFNVNTPAVDMVSRVCDATSGTPVYLPNGFPSTGLNGGDQILITFYDQTPVAGSNPVTYGSGYTPTLSFNPSWIMPTLLGTSTLSNPFSQNPLNRGLISAGSNPVYSVAWDAYYPAWLVTASPQATTPYRFTVQGGQKGTLAQGYSVVFNIVASKTGQTTYSFASTDPQMIVNPT